MVHCKGILCTIYLAAASIRGVNPGGRHPSQILGWRIVGGRRLGRGGSWTGRGRVVKHYYILSCTGSMFESGDF